MLLNNDWVNNEIKRSKDTLKQMKMRTQLKNLCGAGKATLRGIFIALPIYLKKKKTKKKFK